MAATRLGSQSGLPREHVQPRPHPRPHERAILLVHARLDSRLRGRLGPDAFAVDINGEGEVAHLGELSGPALGEIAQSHPLVDHQHARPAPSRIIPGQIAFQGGIALLVLDRFRLHRGVGHADLHQNNRCCQKKSHRRSRQNDGHAIPNEDHCSHAASRRPSRVAGRVRQAFLARGAKFPWGGMPSRCEGTGRHVPTDLACRGDGCAA